MTAKDISLGYLFATTIGQAVAELKELDLSTPASAYIVAWNDEGRTQGKPPIVNLKVLTVEQTAKAVRILLPVLGRPSSYEKECMVPIKAGTSFSTKDSWVRAFEYPLRNLQQGLTVSNMLGQAGVPFFITNSHYLRMFCPIDCFPSNLLKSDLPTEWARMNKASYEKSQNMKKVRSVVKKLDKE